MTSISLVVLTWNRWETVKQTLQHNLANAGYPIREIIHVDNGSQDSFVKGGPGVVFSEHFHELFNAHFAPAIQVIHAENLGVAKGYNRGMLLATSSHIVILGMDRLMPDRWLARWVAALQDIPNTGVISCYSGSYPERFTRPEERFNGHTIQPAFPCEARIHSRQLLLDVGFFHEGFGLYGYEDCEWGDRVTRYADREGFVNYVLPSLGNAVELPDDNAFTVDGISYDKFKERENAKARALGLHEARHALENPYYNPYARIET